MIKHLHKHKCFITSRETAYLNNTDNKTLQKTNFLSDFHMYEACSFLAQTLGAAHVMEGWTEPAEGCNFTEFLFNEMLAKYLHVMAECTAACSCIVTIHSSGRT